MGRKPAFKGLIHSGEMFHETGKLIPDHGKALDGRDREALIAPNRAFEKDHQWYVAKGVPQIFSNRAGREIDVVDPTREEYFKYSRAGSTLETFEASRGKRTAQSTRHLLTANTQTPSNAQSRSQVESVRGTISSKQTNESRGGLTNSAATSHLQLEIMRTVNPYT